MSEDANTANPVNPITWVKLYAMMHNSVYVSNSALSHLSGASLSDMAIGLPYPPIMLSWYISEHGGLG